MAGLKRKQIPESIAPAVNGAKPKKIKKAPTAEVSEPTAPKKAGKTKSKEIGKEKKRKRVPEPEPSSESEEELEESDTSEGDAEFNGFSAAGKGQEANTTSEEENASEMDEGYEDEDQEMEDAAVVAKVKGHKASDSEKAREKKSDAAANPTSSRESHAKQKAVAKERKAAKPNADGIARAKKLWERLRIKSSVQPEERKKLVEELFEIVTGRVKEFVFKHDAVRPVECALKYASAEQRLTITKELKGEFKNLATSRYAKFLIAKLLVEGDDKIKDLVISDFYGHVRRLINHPEAAWILDDAYRGAATSKQKAVLLREWYGPEFAIFKSVNKDQLSANLSEILEVAPEKRKPILDYLQNLINQLIQKKLTGFTMLHDAMLQYYLNLKPESEEAKEFFELLKGDEEGDLIKNLAFTKSGSRLVCHLLAHSDAKGRRNLMKLFKDTVELLAYDKHGHHILLTAYEVIDDTKMTSKAIFPELLGDGTNESAQHEKVIALVTHLTGRKSILSMLCNNAKWLFVQEDKEVLAEVCQIRTTTSKKDPDVRRKELVASIAAAITSTIQHSARNLVESSYGCQFIAEALLSIPNPSAESLAAVAELAKGDPTSEEHIAHPPAGGRMLTALVRGGHFDPETKKVVPVDPPLGFADVLYETIKEHIIEWATGQSSLVVVAMLENENFGHRKEVIKTLEKNKKKLEKAAAAETSEQKARREEKEKIAKGDDDAAKGRKKKKLKEAEVRIGNAGAKVLLEKLK